MSSSGSNSQKYEAPTSWMTVTELAKSLGCAISMIQRAAERHRQARPEWFGAFHSRGKMIEHLAPQLVGRLQQEFPPMTDGPDSNADLPRCL